VEPLFEAAQQLNVACKRNGSMVCAFSKEEEPLLEELYRQGLENEVPGMALLSGDEARALEPNLSPEVTKALHVTNAGIISPYELTVAAVGNAMDNGADLLRNFKVCKITQDPDFFTVTATNEQQIRGKYLVNCAGGSSDKIAALAGDGFFTVIPRAGDYMLLDKVEGGRVSHTIFQCPTANGKGILVSPTVHGNLLVGPTACPVATPDSTGTTADGLEQVRVLAAKSVPKVDFRQVITSFAGVRASEAGGDFIICASKSVPRLIHAAAIDSPGLTCCVSIARYVLGLLSEQGLTLQEKADWNGCREDPYAFEKMNDSEKDAYIKKNPAYGKIVCRCEGVTEGQILQAIRQAPGARDMDGVKRRTRSGMGRCQGGFCGPYVMALLSQELGIPMEQVTKNGGDSYMLQGRIGEV
jgi:glycerol-3-phosphate dehydrogenase